MAQPRVYLRVIIAGMLLSGCQGLPTYHDVLAAAAARQCWPNTAFPTPVPVTVTPAAPDPVTFAPGAPTLTPLPTTTPYPRCPPEPGETQIPWPTPVPQPPPYPTMEPAYRIGGSGLRQTLHLPTNVLTIDLAVHPTENWPVVGSVVWSGTEDPERALVAVYNPAARRWSPALQVDVGNAGLGRHARHIEVAVTPDATVHAIWGMNDLASGDPGVWASFSTDYGAHWSPPQQIAAPCSMVNDAATSISGYLIVLLVCAPGGADSAPTLVVRTPDGTWLAPVRIAVPVAYYSEGSVVVTNDDRRAVAVMLSAYGGVPTALLLTTSLSNPTDWQVQSRSISGSRYWSARGVAYTRPDGTPGITVTWSESDASGDAYALTSLDGGQTWGAAETVAATQPSAWAGFVAPAYDPVADRLAAIWTCCADRGATMWDMAATTHYSHWSVPGSGSWQPLQPGPRVPIVLGSRAADETVTAQARNSRMVWIAWIEQLNRVEVRSLALDQVIPSDQYPPALRTAPGGTEE